MTDYEYHEQARLDWGGITLAQKINQQVEFLYFFLLQLS